MQGTDDTNAESNDVISQTFDQTLQNEHKINSLSQDAPVRSVY